MPVNFIERPNVWPTVFVSSPLSPLRLNSAVVKSVSVSTLPLPQGKRVDSARSRVQLSEGGSGIVRVTVKVYFADIPFTQVQVVSSRSKHTSSASMLIDTTLHNK